MGNAGPPSIRASSSGCSGTALGHPWCDHLALAAAVMVARRLDVASVLGYLRSIQTYLQALFAHLSIGSMADWDANRAMRAYLTGNLGLADTLDRRLRYWSVYTSISNHEHIWLRRL